MLDLRELDEDDLPDNAEIELPSLRSLIFVEYAIFTDYAETFIVPALHILEIPNTFLGEDPLRSLASFISKSECNIQELRVTGKRSVAKTSYKEAFLFIPKLTFHPDYESEDELSDAQTDTAYRRGYSSPPPRVDSAFLRNPLQALLLADQDSRGSGLLQAPLRDLMSTFGMSFAFVPHGFLEATLCDTVRTCRIVPGTSLSHGETLCYCPSASEVICANTRNMRIFVGDVHLKRCFRMKFLETTLRGINSAERRHDRTRDVEHESGRTNARESAVVERPEDLESGTTSSFKTAVIDTSGAAGTEWTSQDMVFAEVQARLTPYECDAMIWGVLRSQTILSLVNNSGARQSFGRGPASLLQAAGVQIVLMSSIAGAMLRQLVMLFFAQREPPRRTHLPNGSTKVLGSSQRDTWSPNDLFRKHIMLLQRSQADPLRIGAIRNAALELEHIYRAHSGVQAAGVQPDNGNRALDSNSGYKPDVVGLTDAVACCDRCCVCLVGDTSPTQPLPADVQAAFIVPYPLNPVSSSNEECSAQTAGIARP
ncbi:hypothetical protein C8R43DRAFT_1134620 [Mycena crocata]|nr:hypothetical protein C8R43DRAFT_1134620 [Mycena crocata]